MSSLAEAATAPPATERRLALLATFLGVVGIGNIMVCLLIWASRGFDRLPTEWTQIPVLPSLAYIVVGSLLATRLPRHPIGWLFLASGLIFGLIPPLELVVSKAYETFRPASPLTTFFAWLVTSFATPTVLGLMTIAGLLFPDGRFVAKRWRIAAVATIAGVVLLGVGTALDPRGLLWYATLPNPFAADAVFDPVLRLWRLVGVVLLPAAAIGAVATLVVRYRTGDAVTRAQVRWVTYAAVIQAIVLVPFILIRYVVTDEAAMGGLVVAMQLAMLAVPIAATFAITRHRLFGIDVLIGRTLVYVPLMAALGGLYALGVAVFQRIFVALTGETNDAALLVALFLIAAAFTPVRKALESAVDRWARRPTSSETDPADDASPPAAVLADAAAERSADAAFDPEIGRVAASLIALRRLEERLTSSPSATGEGDVVELAIDASGQVACPRGVPLPFGTCLGCHRLEGLTTSPPTIRCRPGVVD